MTWIYTFLLTSLIYGADPTGSVRPLANVGQDPQGSTVAIVDETQRFDQTYPLTAAGRVSLSNINGSITIEAWDQNEVRVEYTKTASSKSTLDRITVDIEAQPDHLRIDTEYDRTGSWFSNDKSTVTYKLTVPRGAVLDQIGTVNGSVSLSNLTNVVKASAVNGAVNATNIRGEARLSTVNGDVNADFEKLETGSRISLEAVNGRANIAIPSDSNATVKADSLNGNITNDFQLPVRKGHYVGRDLYGRIGTGDVQIHLNSVNGQLSITRRNDGRSLSPAVDLLPQKGKDVDDNWKDDSDMDLQAPSIDTENLNKELARATKAAAKNISRSTARALSNLNADANIDVEPDVAKAAAEEAKSAAAAIDEASRGLSAAASDSDREREMRHSAAAIRGVDASFDRSTPKFEKKTGSVPVKGVPLVTLTAQGAGLAVRGWDKNEVQYVVIQTAHRREASPLKVSETHTDAGVTLTVTNTGARAWQDVDIEVMVPKRSDLKIVANGQVRVSQVTGTSDITGAEDPINVIDLAGSLKVSSSSGLIRVVGFSGDLDAKSGDGTINLEGDFKSLAARASNGDVTLTLPDNASVDIATSSENVSGEGLTLSPAGSNAGSSLYKVGSGGPRLVVTTDGDLVVRGASALRGER